MPGILSIVAPCHNEQECLPELYKRLTQVADKLDMKVEMILVDDGSADDTWRIIQNLARKDSRVRGISFSRSFGQQAALKAGYQASAGDAVVCLDSDLQHPPEMIPRLVEVWRQGYSVVNTVRRYGASVGFLKRLGSAAFYRLFTFLSGMQFPSGIADFRLLDRQVVRALISMPERNSSLKFAVHWLGFRQAYLEYDCEKRFAGQSKWSFFRLLLLAMQNIVQFSVFPLRLSFILSAVAALMFSVYALYAMYSKFVLGIAVPGWTSIVLTISFLASLQFLTIGLLGEYIGVIYDEVKRRPGFLVRERVGVPACERDKEEITAIL